MAVFLAETSSDNLDHYYMELKNPDYSSTLLLPYFLLITFLPQLFNYHH